VLTGTTGKYAPLNRYLEELPAAQATARLTIAELETLLGAPLAATARRDQSYWMTYTIARNNWRRRGFRAQLDRARGVVTFTRLGLV
jgi:hypothetical protein